MHARKLVRIGLLGAVALLTAALSAGSALGSGIGVEPASYSATVAVGGSVMVTKTVHTPAIPPLPDVYFLTDTTSSMGLAIANVQLNANSIMSGISATQPGAQFGVGNYKDFQDPSDLHDPYVFHPDAAIGSQANAVGAINTNWSASGGSDGPEGTLLALHTIATDPSIGWRPGSSRVLVWFGDAPAHEPFCAAINGLGHDLTTSLVASELAAAHIRVIAISVPSVGYETGLNADSASNAVDYSDFCAIGSVTGQATTIAAATGGQDLFAATPGDVTGQILAGLNNLPVTVTPTPVCDAGLTAGYDSATQTVTSGSDAVFSETFSVAGFVAGGTTLHCNVDFLLNGLHQDGFQQTAAITVPAATGTIVVKKRTLPVGDPTVFSFSGAAAGPVAGDGGTITVSDLAAGTYTSTEAVPFGWDLSDLTCDDPDSSGDVASKTATFRLAAGETITCTFTNTKRATLVVRKVTNPPSDPTQFSFTGHPAGSVAGGGTLTESVVPGTYTSTEGVPTGWDLTGLLCDDPSGDSTSSLADKAATFAAAPGETVTCTFTNTKRGAIVVKKTTAPAGDTTPFTFTGTAAGSIADGGTITVPNLPAGTYTSTETVPGGWDLSGLTCDDATGDSTVDLAGRTATFRVAVGETVTCTFTNTKRGSIVVKKTTVPAGDTTPFTFTGDAAGPIAGDGGTIVVPDLRPGTYSSTESAQTGWDLTALTCTDATGDSSGDVVAKKATFQVGPGETVTCTFTNTQQRGSIVVKKQTLPAGDTTPVLFTGDAAGTVTGDGGTIVVGNLAPGTYSSTETVPTGWDLTALACTDATGDSSGDVVAKKAMFKVAAGETVTCTFTNTKRATIVLKNVTNPSPDPSSTLFAFAGDLAGSIGNGGTLTKSVTAGTYVSTETVPGGWDLSALSCDDLDSTGDLTGGKATFKVVAGETVTCTFTNTKRATLVVKKVTVPSPDPSNTQFAFTGDVAGSIANGGSLTKSVAPGTYTSTETVPAGWDLSTLACSDTDSTGDLATKRATFVAAAGETVTCTFTDTKRATIVVKKVTAPSPDPSNTQFAFTGHPAGSAANGGTVSETVAPGTYTSTETVPVGWDLTTLTCDDTDSTGSVTAKAATFKAAAGETVTCTFTDTKRATIIVKQVTNPSPDGTNQQFAFAGTPTGSIGNGGTLTASVVPGTYTTTQTLPTGWDLTGLTCTDADSTGSLTTRVTTFKVVAGETVTCTYTNTKRGTIIVKQATNPNPDSTGQKFTYAGTLAGLIGNGGTLTATVVPGTYTTTQTVPSGWGLSSVLCTDADSVGTSPSRTATFKVSAGETVTCTFTDTLLPTACSLGYPSGSAPSLSSVVFTANQVIKAAAYLPTTNQLAIWFNGPYALTTAIRQVVVKTKTGTTTTNYPYTAMSANPGRITSTGTYGSMILGNGLKSPNENPQAGTDIGTWTSAYGYLDSNRPWWPGVYVTDITANAAARTGDWQQGGTGKLPTDIFGTWKAAVKTVDQTTTPHTINVVTDAEPAKNNWTLGTGSDTPSGGFTNLQNTGYGAELRWNLASLGLLPGHAYRLQVLLHKRVDYQAQTCMNVFIPGA